MAKLDQMDKFEIVEKMQNYGMNEHDILMGLLYYFPNDDIEEALIDIACDNDIDYYMEEED